MQVPRKLERHATWLITLLLLLLAGLVRFYRLGDSVHPDSLLWFDRCQAFWRALATHRFKNTYLAPHPGVMMMWVGGAVMKLNGTLESNIDAQGLFAVKFLGAAVGTLSSALTYPLVRACLGRAQWLLALVLAFFLVTEPLLVEQARMAHLDMAGLGFAWLGLWLSLYGYEHRSRASALGAGALFGMACLTKASFAAIPATLMTVLLVASALTRFRDRRGLEVAALATAAALVTAFALWPALWTRPVYTLQVMLKESAQVADRGHTGKQAYGVEGYMGYVVRSTPVETALLVLAGLAGLASLPGLRRPLGWVCLSLVPTLIIVSIAPKKLLRYVLPVAPLLCVLASVGVVWLVRRAQAFRRVTPVVVAVALALLFVGRYAHAVWLLPSAQQCTGWPGIDCDRPSDMYFMRPLALGIGQDWQARKKRRDPRVFVAKPELMSPWLGASKAKRAKDADYVVLWDESYADLEAGKLTQSAKQRYGKLGKEVVAVRHHGRVVARVYRGRR